MVFAHPLCGSLFGFEQLVHGHGLVVLLGCVICSLAIKNHMYECGFAKIAHWILPEERFGPTSALPTIRGLNSGLTHAEHNAIPNPTAADYGSQDFHFSGPLWWSYGRGIKSNYFRYL